MSDAARIYRVTVKVWREYSATIAIPARSQAAADDAALAAFYKWACEEDGPELLPFELGFPPPWKEHESGDYEAEIDTTFRCVDCEKDTSGGEYYMVRDNVWATSGLAPHGGMLCLACLERRIGRPLTGEDFTAVWPSAAAWERHIAARPPEPMPFELLWRQDEAAAAPA